MTDDPYAKYLTPPSAPASGGADPYAKYLTPPGNAAPVTAAPAEQHGALYSTLFKEGSGGNAFGSADEGILPAARDYALAGLDDLTLGYGVPNALKEATARAQSNLGPMSYITGAAAYGLGPGKVLGPAGEAIGALSPVTKGAASVAAEGALAGGASGLSHGTGDPISDVGWGAIEGGVLGGVAGSLGAGAQKALSKPGSIDPAAAIASTKADRDALYGQLQKTPVGSNSLKNAYASATLTPGMAADVSPGFNTLIGRQLEQVDGGGITANDVADFAKNLRAGATSNGDQILAGKISDNLLSALPPDAAQTLQAANAAHQKYVMAQNLAEWQRKVGAGGSVGQAPLTEAENWYQNDPESYKTLGGLANQGQGHSWATRAAGHAAANMVGAVGGSIAGFPGAAIGDALGYMYAMPWVYKAMKGVDKKAALRAFQQAYPQMTGQPLKGATTGSQLPGEMIKNLMLGGAY